MSDHDERLAVLQEAVAHLEAGRLDRVSAALEPMPDGGGSLGRALLRVARGLEAEAEGRAAEAGPIMEEAFGMSPALPAPALRALVGFFRRNGRRLLAHHAFLMLQVLEPGSLAESVRGLPADERARYVPWAVRASIGSGHQATYHLAAEKESLRSRLGSEAAAVIMAGVRGPQGERRAVRRALTPLIEHAREAAVDYEELIPATRVAGTAVRALGGSPARAVERRGRALFGGVLSDVVVTGRSGILLTEELALMDVQDDEVTRRPHDLTVDPLVVTADGDGLILLEPADRGALPRLPEAVWLGGVHSVAFGHWIIEFLPKIWMLMTRPGFGRVPLLVDARMPAQHLEAVRLFAGAANPVHVLYAHESVRVDRLWVASALGYLPVGPLPAPPGPRVRPGLDDAGFTRLMTRIAPTLESIDTTDSPARLYLGRKPSQHRRLANADEIEGLLAAAGFEARDFGELSFAEQLRLVRGAEWIVGPAGSALENVIFGRPGLRVGVLVPNGPENVDWLAQCCRARGIELTAVVGDVVDAHPNYRWMSDYRVDQELLASYLEGASPSDSDDRGKPPRRKVATIRVWAEEPVATER